MAVGFLNNLPLSYCKRPCFETIGQHFGGLVNIPFQLLILLIVQLLKLKWRKIVVVSFRLIETYRKFGNFSLHFGDIYSIDPPHADREDSSI